MKYHNVKTISASRDYSISLHEHLEAKVDDLLEMLEILEDRMPDSELLSSIQDWIQDLKNFSDEVQEILDRVCEDDSRSTIHEEDLEMLKELAQQLPDDLVEGLDIFDDAWISEEISDKLEALLRGLLLRDVQPVIDSGWRLYNAMILAD